MVKRFQAEQERIHFRKNELDIVKTEMEGCREESKGTNRIVAIPARCTYCRIAILFMESCSDVLDPVSSATRRLRAACAHQQPLHKRVLILKQMLP